MNDLNTFLVDKKMSVQYGNTMNLKLYSSFLGIDHRTCMLKYLLILLSSDVLQYHDTFGIMH